MLFKNLYETEDFLVVNKLKPCSYHSDEGTGFFEQVKAEYPAVISVHRLDKPTVGLCLFAKNIEAAKIFGDLFSSQKVEKIYLALSDKKPTKKQGLVMGDMEKSRSGSYRLSKTKKNPAITQFFTYSLAPGKRLFILKPHSGKTHQLRVMMKSIGSPIVGDDRYKGSICESLYLQAHQLKFTFKNKYFIFTLNSFFDIESEKVTEKSLEDLIWPDLKKS